MMKKSLALLALATALALTSVAKADSFTFTFSDDGVSGSGTLYGTYEGVGNPWLLTSGAGTFSDGDDSGSVSLVANPNGPGGSTLVAGIVFDNLLDLFQNSGSYLDGDGLLLQFDGSGDYLNLFFSYSFGGGGPIYYGWYDSPQGNVDDGFESASGNFAITSYDISDENPVPEPGSFLLFGTGLFAIAGLLLHRRAASALPLNS